MKSRMSKLFFLWTTEKIMQKKHVAKDEKNSSFSAQDFSCDEKIKGLVELTKAREKKIHWQKMKVEFIERRYDVQRA